MYDQDGVVGVDDDHPFQPNGDDQFTRLVVVD